MRYLFQSFPVFHSNRVPSYPVVSRFHCFLNISWQYFLTMHVFDKYFLTNNFCLIFLDKKLLINNSLQDLNSKMLFKTFNQTFFDWKMFICCNPCLQDFLTVYVWYWRERFCENVSLNYAFFLYKTKHKLNKT